MEDKDDLAVALILIFIATASGLSATRCAES